MNIPEGKLQPLVDWCNTPATPPNQNVVGATLLAENNRGAISYFSGYLRYVKPALAPAHFSGILESTANLRVTMSVTITLTRNISMSIFGALVLNQFPFAAGGETNEFDLFDQPAGTIGLSFQTPDNQGDPALSGIIFDGALRLFATTIVNWGNFSPVHIPVPRP
jgi:hypothetical protein